MENSTIVMLILAAALMGVSSGWMMNATIKNKTFKTTKFPQSKMEVMIINDDAQKLHNAFGISDERGKEIFDSLKPFEHTNIKQSEMMVHVSKVCVHANELAFACYLIGRSQSASEIVAAIIPQERFGQNFD